jgi:hypothetical protein
VSENFLAVPLGDAVFCLLVNPRGAASMWKYSIIGDSWSRVLIPEMTNVSFLGFFVDVGGEFHDQGDAKWIVIRRPLRHHNDKPFGRPNPGWPIGRPAVGHPQGVFGGLSYY